LPIIFGHIGNDLALRQVYHYLQLAESGRFHFYDFGASKNQALYGTEFAPDYDHSKITAPAILISGMWDGVVPSGQVKKFSLLLPNLVEYRDVSMTHFDFMIDKNVRQKLNIDVVGKAVKYKTCQYCFF
jgi:pimeloyl-ACP methyl ester carboxylesterase